MDLEKLLIRTKSEKLPIDIKTFKRRISVTLKAGNGRILKEEFNRFVDDKVFLMGLGIWLGEGTKEIVDEKRIELINSEILIIMKFLRFLKEIGLLKNRIRVKIIIKFENDDKIKNKIKEAESFWSKETGIPKQNFWKTIVVIGKTKRLRRLKFGTLTIRVLKGTLLFKLFSQWCKML